MPASFLSEAELHGLVDGRLDAARRTELLQRVAASPLDRERVASWQEQGDLLRAAFRGIDREVVPSELDLRSPVRVHHLPIRRPEREEVAPPIVAAPPRSARAGRRVYAAATAACVGLGAAWIIATARPVTPAPAEPERADPDAVLARRALAALGVIRGGEGAFAGAAVEPPAMPTTVIPDLTASGFAFSGAEPQAGEPAAIVFHYRNGAAEQVAVGVARLPRGDTRGAAPLADGTYAWRLGSRAFAVAGTMPRERLRAIAVLLKGDLVEE